MHDRRAFMSHFATLGLASSLLPGILWAQIQQQDTITKEMVKDAEALAAIELTDAERDAIVHGINQNARAYTQLRTVDLANSVLPAIQFDPVLASMTLPTLRKPHRFSKPAKLTRPANLEHVAFWPVLSLAQLIRARQVSPIELTEMYLARLKKHGPTLEAVITLMEDRALAQARAADAEIRKGHYKGMLHGIPWGAKDLLATKGVRTTWGAKPYEDQMLSDDATVVKRLDAAGAILLAKLTLGALANGDIWFGGRTRNPWKLDQGSSGSSAGPAATVSAGLVPFSIGSETLGSIVSPSTRTGVTGLRPTFGRVPRTGAMTLSWSMDKLGPLARTVEDTAAVLSAIIGPDGEDPTVRDMPFNWDAHTDVRKLRVGYYKSAFDLTGQRHSNKPFDDAVLDVLRSKIGIDLLPFETPTDLPIDALHIILSAEAGAAFDELTRSHKVDLIENSPWPSSFKQARFIPAVEYMQANRIRTLLMQEMARAMEQVDVFVTPPYGGNVLLLTNLTGHPAVTVPSGFAADGTPVSISFIGKLYGEAEMLAVAKAYQDATGFHLKYPPQFAV